MHTNKSLIWTIPVKKLRFRWKRNVHKDLNYIERETVDWIRLVQVWI